MGDGNFFRGTGAEQDSRFSDKQKKMLKTMKFPENFDQKVDTKKINQDVIRAWITQKIFQMLKFDDDILVEFVMESMQERFPDPKILQINLTGFLEKKTPEFMKDLWTMLLSAQTGTGGIPQEILERKKMEILQKKEEEEKIAQRLKGIENEARKRRDEMNKVISSDIPAATVEKDKVSSIKVTDPSTDQKSDNVEKREGSERGRDRDRDRDRRGNSRDRSRGNRRGSRSRTRSPPKRRRSKSRSRSRSRSRSGSRSRRDRRSGRSRHSSYRSSSRDRKRRHRSRSKSRDRSRSRSRDKRRNRSRSRSKSRSRSRDRKRESGRDRRRHRSPSENGDKKRRGSNDRKKDDPESKKKEANGGQEGNNGKAEQLPPAPATQAEADMDSDLERELREKAIASLLQRKKSME